MPPLWGYRLAAFVPPLAFAVVPPLVLLAFAVVYPLVCGGMASHRLAPVAFPFRLLLDLVIRPISPIAPIGLILYLCHKPL